MFTQLLVYFVISMAVWLPCLWVIATACDYFIQSKKATRRPQHSTIEHLLKRGLYGPIPTRPTYAATNILRDIEK
jgi:hypothetical protein